MQSGKGEKASRRRSIRPGRGVEEVARLVRPRSANSEVSLSRVLRAVRTPGCSLHTDISIRLCLCDFLLCAEIDCGELPSH
jgi:hypothetical protein